MNPRHGASCAPKPLDRTAEITTTPLPKADLERASRTPSAVEVCPSARSRVGDEVVAPRRHATVRPWQSDREPDSRPRGKAVLARLIPVEPRLRLLRHYGWGRSPGP